MFLLFPIMAERRNSYSSKKDRNISLIVIHCSPVRPNQTNSAGDIDNWHKERVTNGIHWKGIDYHHVARRDGSVEIGLHLSEVGAHCVEHKRHSIGICYEGGLNSVGKEADTRTPEQVRALRQLVKKMRTYFPR